MITDRVSTTIILQKIAVKRPDYGTMCAIYVIIDHISHFFYFVAMSYQHTHHKENKDNWLMAVYYQPDILKIMCVGSELCFILYYLTKKNRIGLRMLLMIPIIKTFFHLVHMYLGMAILSSVPAKETFGEDKGVHKD